MSFSALAGRIPEWGRLFDEAAYLAFHDALREELTARGQPFELHADYARLGDWELPLLPLAERCAGAPRRLGAAAAPLGGAVRRRAAVRMAPPAPRRARAATRAGEAGARAGFGAG